MKAEKDSEGSVQRTVWVPIHPANLLYEMNDPGESLDATRFFVTYTFQAATPEYPDSRGIRELESPLSDY